MQPKYKRKKTKYPKAWMDCLVPECAYKRPPNHLFCEDHFQVSIAIARECEVAIKSGQHFDFIAAGKRILEAKVKG